MAKLKIYGDSISAGANASNQSLAYPALLGTLTGLEVLNVAEYSMTVQESVQPWNATNSLYNLIFDPTEEQETNNPIPDYDPSYEILMFRLGVNDILQQEGSTTNVTTFKAAYKACLQAFLDKGWPKEVFRIINIGSYLGSDANVISLLPQYNQAMLEAVQEMKLGNLIDLHTFDINNDPESMYDDFVHPNDFGHDSQANYIYSVINELMPHDVDPIEILVPHGRFII